MINAVAFCPCPPVLIPEIAQGAAPELDDLRSACRTAIKRLAAAAPQLVVLGPGPRGQHYPASTRGSLAPYGLPLDVALGSDEPGPAELPLSLTIGAWLLRETLGPNCGATGWSIAPADERYPAIDDGSPIGLLAMGDGSARRSTSAPGYFDERAEAFDASIADALRAGDAHRLHPHPGVEVGEQLLAAGTRVWDAVASYTEPDEWDAELLYAAAPYGVGYAVAAWTRRG